MKFAHLGDCHIGGWREPKLKDLGVSAFVKAIDSCIAKEVDFILISGDLFNTPLPSIDGLKNAVTKLKEAKDKGIPVYVIAGSHDFSASGKTMLDVLEKADLFINVFKGSVENGILKLKFTHDPKTEAKITGIIGKKGMLDKKYYEQLDKAALENEPGFKIFMFHTALDELKTKDLERMESAPLSLMPKGFDYYAGGHVHIVTHKTFDGYKHVTYPGALFPNNFSELEKFKHGGFYIYNEGEVTWEPVIVSNVESFSINCDGKTPFDVKQLILDQVKDKELNNAIVTIRLSGVLDGKVSDIEFKEIFDLLNSKSASFVMKNTNALQMKGFEEVEVDSGSVEETEEKLISESSGQISIEGDEKELTKQLMLVLSAEKAEGEKTSDYEKRVVDETKKVLGLD
ncbi:exonuclease SbcCD subunit D [Nanoarchaeota archaeon]